MGFSSATEVAEEYIDIFFHEDIISKLKNTCTDKE